MHTSANWSIIFVTWHVVFVIDWWWYFFLQKYEFEHQLYCFYKKEHPFYKLRPLKVEVVYFDPYMQIFHDLITETEINKVKEIATPMVRKQLHDDVIAWKFVPHYCMALCEGNPPVSGGFPHKGPVIQVIYVICVVSLNNLRKKKHSSGQWFEMTWRSCVVSIWLLICPFVRMFKISVLLSGISSLIT